LTLKVLLLIAGAFFVVRFGPFHGDSWQAVLTGMTLVAAMAVQNALHGSTSASWRRRCIVDLSCRASKPRFPESLPSTDAT
jgi:hypothetical protein